MSYNASPAGTGSGGKSAGGYQPSTGGYQPTQSAQQQFQSGVAQQQPGTAQQLNQISGLGGPAMTTMVNQQMAPQGATGPAPTNQFDAASGINPQGLFNQYGSALGMNATAPTYGGGFGPSGDQSQPIQGMGANPIGLPNGQQLDLSQIQGTADRIGPGDVTTMDQLPGGSMYDPMKIPGVQNVLSQHPGWTYHGMDAAPSWGAGEYQDAQGNEFNADGTPWKNPAMRAVQDIAYPGPPPTPPAPVAQAKPAPAPMPTKATQGYTSRLAPAPRPQAQPIRPVAAPGRAMPKTPLRSVIRPTVAPKPVR